MYQIFIPKISGANPRHLDKVGLGHLLQDGDVGPQMCDVLDHGPDGGPGLLFSWPGTHPAYVPGELTWYPAKPDPVSPPPEDRMLQTFPGRFWWGIPNSGITPNDITRSTHLPGKWIDINGQTWHMPNILLLPHDFILDDQGREAREVSPHYRSIYERGTWAYELIRAQIADGIPAPAAELRRYVLEMLSLNYRLFRDLAYHLRLMTEQNWFLLACASIDIETLIQIEQDVAKKKRAPTPPTSPPGDGPSD